MVRSSATAVCRRRIARDTKWCDSSEVRSYIRHGIGAVRPYVYGGPDLVELIEVVFGAQIMERVAVGGGYHVEAAIADSAIVLEVSEQVLEPAQPCSIYVYVSDVDGAFERAVSLGAEPVAEPAEKPYDERQAGFRDRSGNMWWIATYTDPR
jgi:PhnB protein